MGDSLKAMAVGNQHSIEQSEWRRGGDPANPPIDKPGRYQRRGIGDGLVASPIYVVTREDLQSDVLRFELDDGEMQVSGMFWGKVSSANSNDSWEWRYIGPLPGTEQPAKGGREAFNRAFRVWAGDEGLLQYDLLDTSLDFLESAAGRAALRDYLGDEAGAALAEAKAEAERLRETVKQQAIWHEDADECKRLRAECDAYRKAYGCLSCDEQHDRGTMCPPHEVRSSDPHWKQRIASLAAERDALRSEVALLREAERSAQERVAELEKERQQWRSRVGCIADRIHTILIGAGLTTAGGSREDRIEKAAWAVESLVARCENQRKELARLNEQARLSAQSAAEKREDGEKEPPLNRDEAIRRLWAMARGQRDQIEDLQERIAELEKDALSFSTPLKE